jgi:hypothetical protein
MARQSGRMTYIAASTIDLLLQRRAYNWMRKGRCNTWKGCMYVIVQMNTFGRDMHQVWKKFSGKTLKKYNATK